MNDLHDRIWKENYKIADLIDAQITTQVGTELMNRIMRRNRRPIGRIKIQIWIETDEEFG